MYILCAVISYITKHFHSVLTYNTVLLVLPGKHRARTGGKNSRQALINEALRSLLNTDRRENTVF